MLLEWHTKSRIVQSIALFSKTEICLPSVTWYLNPIGSSEIWMYISIELFLIDGLNIDAGKTETQEFILY
jgi:hypothetical protein